MDLHIPNVLNETPGTLRRIAELLQTFADQAEQDIRHVEPANREIAPPLLPILHTPGMSAETLAELHGGVAPPPPPGFVTAAQAEPWPFPPPPPSPLTASQAAPALFGVANREVSPPPPPPVVTDTKLDVAGLPWDARIHATTKTMTANGKWKYKKGVDPELVAEVEAQWKAVAALPTPGAPSPQLPLAPVAAPTPLATTTAVPATVTNATTSPSDDGPPTTFAQYIVRTARMQAQGKITLEQINAALGTIGLPSANMLAARVDLIPAAWELVSAMASA